MGRKKQDRLPFFAEWRKRWFHTQGVLAEALGLANHESVSKWERQERGPDVELILSKLTGDPLHDFKARLDEFESQKLEARSETRPGNGKAPNQEEACQQPKSTKPYDKIRPCSIQNPPPDDEDFMNGRPFDEAVKLLVDQACRSVQRKGDPLQWGSIFQAVQNVAESLLCKKVAESSRPEGLERLCLDLKRSAIAYASKLTSEGLEAKLAANQALMADLYQRMDDGEAIDDSLCDYLEDAALQESTGLPFLEKAWQHHLEQAQGQTEEEKLRSRKRAHDSVLKAGSFPSDKAEQVSRYWVRTGRRLPPSVGQNG